MRHQCTPSVGRLGSWLSGGQPAAKAVLRRLNMRRLAQFMLRLAASSVALVVLAFMTLVAPAACSTRAAAAAPAAPPAQVAVAVVVSFGPPALPFYYQPPIPGPGYYWVPGYWAWDPYYGYFWVPGTWVFAPFAGALWTPGYWWWSDPDDGFVWFPGYWGPVVGFYGGINYGFGYTGNGYQGGYWRGGSFFYNRSVTNITTTNITNVYNTTVVENNTTRVSYNGGSGGTTARPTSAELAAARQKRSVATSAQIQQEQTAKADPKQRASANQGRPAVAATPAPGKFTGAGVVAATRAGAPYKAPPMSKAQPSAPVPSPSPARTEKGSHPFAPRGSEPATTPAPTPNVNHPPKGHQPPPPAAAPPERAKKPEPPPSGSRAQPQENRHNAEPAKKPGKPEKPENPPGPPGR